MIVTIVNSAICPGVCLILDPVVRRGAESGKYNRFCIPDDREWRISNKPIHGGWKFKYSVTGGMPSVECTTDKQYKLLKGVACAYNNNHYPEREGRFLMVIMNKLDHGIVKAGVRRGGYFWIRAYKLKETK